MSDSIVYDANSHTERKEERKKERMKERKKERKQEGKKGEEKLAVLEFQPS